MNARIAFLGAGVMGAGMVQCLLKRGHVVTVWERTPGRHDALHAMGASLARSISDTMQDADIVIGCLANTAVTRECYLGSNGALAFARPGQLFVEHGTFDPALAAEISRRALAVECAFLDAPVTGGPERAQSGALVTMVGGDEQALALVRDVLAAYCSQIVRVGESGGGLRLKLINQLLVSIHVVAAAEASALVMRNGIDPHIAHSVLMGGWAASSMLDRELPRACSGDFEHSGATVGKLVEIQPLIETLLARAGVRSVLFAPARGAFDEAMSRGAADLELAAIVTQFLPAQPRD